MKHPAKTKAQRAVLDAIGCGDSCPPMSRQTRESMLSKGLITKVGDKTLGKDRFGMITVPIYEMPVGVHIEWCSAMAIEE